MSKPNTLQLPHTEGVSFLAFLLSISIYTSIFFFFNLSPSSLLHSTYFWFAISNNLILILAADYGSFSSSPNNIHTQPITTTDKKMISFSQETKNPSLEIVCFGDEKKIVEVSARETQKGRSRIWRKERRMSLQRSRSERREREQEQEEEEEENEFLRMSNEELNKRVEEFIQRFNTQIRLQRNQVT